MFTHASYSRVDLWAPHESPTRLRRSMMLPCSRDTVVIPCLAISQPSLVLCGTVNEHLTQAVVMPTGKKCWKAGMAINPTIGWRSFTLEYLCSIALCCRQLPHPISPSSSILNLFLFSGQRGLLSMIPSSRRDSCPDGSCILL